MDANLRKVPVPLAEDLIKTIRLLALFGRKMFVIYLFQPLDEAGWKRNPANDPARKMLERIKTASAETTAIHTIGPLSKRLISQALNETLSMTGDASIFFLEKMMEHNQAAISREAIEFVQIIEPSLAKFQKIYQEKSSVLFSEALQKMSPADFKNERLSTMSPVSVWLKCLLIITKENRDQRPREPERTTIGPLAPGRVEQFGIFIP